MRHSSRTLMAAFIIVIIIFAGLIISRPFIRNLPQKLFANQNFIDDKVLYEKKRIDIQIGNKRIHAEIVTDEKDLQKGLSGRPYLENETGMLFIFPRASINDSGIWMKDMSFPLDVLWLDKNRTVITIVKDMEPGTYPQVFYPTKDASYVIELSKDELSGSGIKVGDSVDFI